MSYRNDVHRVAKAIQSAERCPNYYRERGEPCDGLDGCDACLELAAKAALIAVEEVAR